MAECYGTRPALATYRIEGRLLAQSSKLVTASSSDGGERGAASFREGCGTVNTDSTKDTPEAPGGDNGLEEVLARLQRETPLWRDFLAAHRDLTDRLAEQMMRDHQLPLEWFDVLVHLAEVPGMRLRQRVLRDRLLLSESGVSRLLVRMERAGFITRAAADEDR